MPFAPLPTWIRALPLLSVTLLAVGCGDDAGTAPDTTPNAAPVITHYDLAVKMSSINAQENCEDAPGNPGEFRYTLTVERTDEFDNDIIIGTRSGSMSLHDGDILGATSEPIRFRVPAEPGASFTVAYTVGEYDGDTADMERRSWSHHVLDRNDEQMWAAGHIAYDTYVEAVAPGEVSYGVLKFTTWSTRDTCKGSARYLVEWTPVYADDTW